MWVKWEEKGGESVSQWVSPWLKGKAENRKWVASTDDRKKKNKKQTTTT